MKDKVNLFGKSKFLLRYLKYVLILLLFLILMGSLFNSELLVSQDIKKGDELNYNIIEEGNFSTEFKENYLAFSREDIFIDYYSKLKSLPNRADINPGINFDYNMGVVISLGEIYRKGYNIKLDRAVYQGEAIEVFVNIDYPENERKGMIRTPYLIASVYNNKDIRKSLKMINFIDNRTNKLIRTIPVKKIKKPPFYEIPVEVDVVKVEKGDYGNFDFESYGAFNHHLDFDAAYMSLKENKEYRVFPPVLSFKGNIAIIMNLGEKKNGGYEILPEGAYTTAYTLGKELYIMVRKKSPTEENIRYYDITRPYFVGSVHIGLVAENIRYVYFVDEKTGRLLVKSKLPTKYQY